MSGCTLTNQEACPCSCADHIENHATYHCSGNDYDHAGESKYGTNCNETRDGGHCGSMGLSWTDHDASDSETCTFNSPEGCKLTNAQACCMACAPMFFLSFILTFGYVLANFERLVLGCIEAEFCK